MPCFVGVYSLASGWHSDCMLLYDLLTGVLPILRVIPKNIGVDGSSSSTYYDEDLPVTVAGGFTLEISDGTLGRAVGP